MVLSQPAKLWVKGSDKTVVDVFAQDYLTVLRGRSSDDTRRLFDTHEYNTRLVKPDIQVTVFKKEVEMLEGVVPLVEYVCYTFYLRNLKLRRLPRDFRVVRVHKENTDLLHDFLREGFKMFDIAITLNIEVLLNLLKTNQMYMYALKRGDQVFALYWFKNAHVKWDLGDTLHFVASFKNTENVDLFSLGFGHSLREILKEYREYRILMMDSIGHNDSIAELWINMHDIIVKTRCAYYLYNYGMESMLKEKCLVVI